MRKAYILLQFLLLLSITTVAQQVTTSSVGFGWSSNSINTTIFRKNSITSDHKFQFVSYYDGEGFVCIAKRKLNDKNWTVHRTDFKGNVRDAHNSISIILDKTGHLHLGWDQHNNKLNYAKSEYPYAFDKMIRTPMLGRQENSVTYPEFYKKPDGDILFLYRDGGSGRGNLVLNTYDTHTKTWHRIQDNLIDGEGKRNAYPQFCVDNKGFLHISWVWRNTPNVETNHNLCYAISKDGGQTWQKSTGDAYTMPIKYNDSEIIHEIPEKSDLMNQTSMTVDRFGQIYITNYWRDQITGLPQYHIVSSDKGNSWHARSLSFRTTDFSLAGAGTKKIPISRPQILVDDKSKKVKIYLLFRDEELGSKPTAAVLSAHGNAAELITLSEDALGAWEPSYDIDRWKRKKQLSLFTQAVTQIDGEGLADAQPTVVKVLDIRF